ncbi:uroporphyrinogen-III synthase-like [Hydractinia symbiolongicarpus]|uniref:uroporphyrinogen-III synthase-like n=1 Tax=Hydractinia symbiolongicarpus TaxID=13093 RepID=UPI00254FAADC|nr:uroporphyrinogen-III synthase-like [Hydractinia symbiolongicarpus]
MDVLLLREKDGENDKYHTLFKENGYNATSIPVLDFMFCNLEILTDIISNISDYSGVIFTSKRAITAFSNCCSSSDIQYISKLSDFNIYVVGHSSAASLTKLGLKCIGENTGNAEELSELIISKEQEVHKPFLFPCGNLAKETIPTKLAEKKISVKSVSCYKTVPNKQFISKFKLFLDKSIPDYIAYFSPSGIDFYFSQIKELLGDITVVKFLCIGRTTEKALKNFDADVYGVAKKPTAQGLLDAIKEGS